MRNEPWAPLEELAAQYETPIVDAWSRSSVTVRGSIDVRGLLQLAQQQRFLVRLLFGADDIELTLNPNDVPLSDELSSLKDLVQNERAQAELLSTRDYVAIEALLQGQLAGAFVEYRESGWIRTEEALVSAVETNWIEVASTFPTDALRCGTNSIGLESVNGPNPPGSFSVFLPLPDQLLSDNLVHCLAQVANAAAWTQIAVRSTYDGPTMYLALHQDQEAAITLELDRVDGAMELLRWRMEDSKANREEALRYVLRFVTASVAVLPDAKIVRTLAERQYLALARDRAAEVFRAVADSQRATTDLLRAVLESLSKLVEDTTTTASATVVAVVGLVALVVQNGTLLPSWLILLAAITAVLGVAAVVASRWSRIGDQEEAVSRLRKRLDDDPLLPARERLAMKDMIRDAKVARRASQARAGVLLLGLVASAVALAAAGWLVKHPVSVSTSTTSSGTSSTPAKSPTSSTTRLATSTTQKSVPEVSTSNSSATAA